MSPALMKTYNTTSQQYGTYFGGFGWSIYGCLTFRNTVTRKKGEKIVRAYMRRLGMIVKARIPYIAVPEFRTSGCGLPPIPLHFHFLAACPPQWEPVFSQTATALWEEMAGNCKIDPYDPGDNGAHYVAKLASHENFDWMVGNLDHITYAGPTDLYAGSQMDPYVPEHAKGHICPSTLVLQKKVMPPDVVTPVQLIANHNTPTTGKTIDHYETLKAPALNVPKPNTAKGKLLPTYAKPDIPIVRWIWQKTLKAKFGKTITLTPPQHGQLKVLRNELGPATLCTIEYIIEHWQEFANTIPLKKGYKAHPTVPSIGFLLAHRRTAFKMTLMAVKSKGKKTPQEFAVLEQAELLKEYWGSFEDI